MSHALSSARRTVDYIRALEREQRRLRQLVDKLTGEALAAKTAAAHLRDEVAQLRAELAEERAVAAQVDDAATQIIGRFLS